MKAMYVYSGECRFCKVGLETDLFSDFGEPLMTGDIVISYTVTKDTGFCQLGGLTIVVAHHYENINGQEPQELEEKEPAFVMGIKTCDIQEPEENYPKTVWRARKVKSYLDVIDGEQWKAYGFSFKEL